MTRATRIGIVLVYIGLLPIVAAVYFFGVRQFGSGSWQTFSLVTLVAAAGAVVASLIVEFTVADPARRFAELITKMWNDSRRLPDSRDLPEELRWINKSYREVLMGKEKQLASLHELQRFDEEKREFIAIANHQLRTPLGEIRWGMNSLSDMLANNKRKEVRDMIHDLNDAVNRIVTITDQFLVAAELTAGEARRHIAVDVVTLVRAAIEKLAHQTKERNIAVEVTHTQGVVSTVTGDPLLLGFVFETLITNAVSYGAINAPVNIRMKNAEGTIVIEVENTGAEISPEELPLLFEKFFRGEAARRKRPNGSGLALHVSKRIVNQMNGTIAAKSVDDNRIIFTVSLPLSASSKAQRFATTY